MNYNTLIFSIDELPETVRAVLGFATGRKKFTLEGDLGAGKTTFVQAFCRELGVQENVTSPTFSIINEYHFVDNNGREQPVHHIDLYRLKSAQEALDIGIGDCLFDEHYCLIEWPGIVQDWLPEDCVHLSLTVLDDGRRQIEAQLG
jgi:tRNA threonylcarbamoyladenosine biosynthesis protein TsaE